MDQVRRGVCHAPRRTARADAARFTGKRDDDLVATRLAPDARETVSEDPAAQICRELAFHIAWQPAALGSCIAQLGEHRLRVPRDELVQHRALWCPASVAGERPSGRTGRAFVEAAREHARA